MPKQCRSCKWWCVDDRVKSATRKDGFGSCLRIKHMTDANLDEVKAVTMDGSDYSSILYTRADFGCVEWEMDDPNDS